jgi:hypothetical protein
MERSHVHRMLGRPARVSMVSLRGALGQGPIFVSRRRDAFLLAAWALSLFSECSPDEAWVPSELVSPDCTAYCGTIPATCARALVASPFFLNTVLPVSGLAQERPKRLSSLTDVVDFMYEVSYSDRNLLRFS